MIKLIPKIMERQEIKSLFNYLESNRKELNTLQNKFLTSSKEIYSATRVLTQRQIESLLDMKELISTAVIKEVIFETESYRAQYSSFDNLSPYV
jgi:hypothetical protein